jgi:hypothetical protein
MFVQGYESAYVLYSFRGASWSAGNNRGSPLLQSGTHERKFLAGDIKSFCLNSNWVSQVSKLIGELGVKMYLRQTRLED